MKIELKPFQETAARDLREELEFAWQEAARGRAQAIVLSSPTGSGKTVTITALMEWIYAGYESFPADRQAVFLWLSDSPELNAQSRDKILRQSSIFAEPDLVIVESPFSQAQFHAGIVYFLNTQKLGKDSLLTKTGDGRDYTIWQTIQNTATNKPGHFYVILDEAHRGMAEKRGEREQATSIVQRFIKGYPEGGLQPLKLIIGMSATPERFNRLIEGTGRISRPIDIRPDDVRDSGLLKDRIVLYHPNESQPADWSLLEEATRRWRAFGAAWREYCAAQKMEQTVEPVLVIQVEDATADKVTRTNLDELVQIVERVTGRLPEGAWAHAFQEDKTLSAGGQPIRKIEASQIEFDRAAQVVLFKMSLTTGWDCPRAEVMMSFRRAKDHTLIAQLVGRMVRTPLARAIEAQEFLNTVALYLPHYDDEGLRAILDKLNNPDPETGLAISVEDGAQLVPLKRDPAHAALFAKLETLPTYRVERIAKTSHARRLMRLARQITFDEIDVKAWSRAKQLVVKILTDELKRLNKKPDFIGNIAANQEIEMREVWVEYGEWKELPAAKVVKIKATPENIDDLFAECGRKLGEGLHMTFWKSRRDDTDGPSRAKLELFGILQDQAAWGKLEKACGDKIAELFKAHRDAIAELPSGKQEEYNRIKRVAKHPEPETLKMPLTMEVKREKPNWARHLYVDDAGKFGAKLNTWESAVLEEELGKPDVVGWLRNMPRKPWALCVPYRMDGDDKPFYPDLIVFRSVKGRIIPDIFDPHDSGLPDAVDKAKGLADYAKKHGDQFGRIELIVQSDKNKLRRLDLTQESVRESVARVTSKPHLDKLFEDAG